MGAPSKRYDLPMKVSGHRAACLAGRHRLCNLFPDYGPSASPETTLSFLGATFACCGGPALRISCGLEEGPSKDVPTPTLDRRDLEVSGGASFVLPTCDQDIRNDLTLPHRVSVRPDRSAAA